MFNLSSTDVLLKQSCNPPGLQKEIEGPYGQQHKWLTKKIPLNTPLTQIPCTCKKNTTPGAKKVLPSFEENDVIIYSNCMRTLYACMCRQLQLMPEPDTTIMQQFHAWFITEFDKEIAPLLDDFDYNPATWFNHLTASQQAEIIRLSDNKHPKVFQDINIFIHDEPPKYSMFCKREVQIVEKPELNYYKSNIPKARAISAPDPEDKYTLGPVTWHLEQVFANRVKGYCGSKNWQEMETELTDMYRDGYKFVIFGDGSGWDRTQGKDLKFIDRTIYNYLVDKGKIQHVDPEIFRTKSTAIRRVMTGKLAMQGKLVPVFKAEVEATVMTGNPDTTLMNTTRMAMVCRFIMDKSMIPYKLWCKGDDFIIFIKEEINLNELFYKYWCKKGFTGSHGLGIILKFLKTAPISDFDFCSTNVIQYGDKFKMVRLPNRMYPLTHWSIKALSLSKEEQQHYMYEQAIALEKWAHNMPYYGDYVKLIKFYYKQTQVQSRKGVNKIQLLDGRKFDEIEQHEIELGFDHYYSSRLRVSDLEIPDSCVYDFLLNKYGWSKAHIDYHFATCRQLGVVDTFDNG